MKVLLIQDMSRMMLKHAKTQFEKNDKITTTTTTKFQQQQQQQQYHIISYHNEIESIFTHRWFKIKYIHIF